MALGAAVPRLRRLPVSGGPDELLAALRRGDQEAFRQVAEAEFDAIYVVACGILGSNEDAEDACQEVLLRLYQAAPRLLPNTTLRPWLRRVCVNYCLDECRRRRRRRMLTQAPANLDAALCQPGPEQAVDETAFRRAVARALAQLTPKQRAVFVLRHFRGCSVRETAEILGSAEGTVKAQLSRAVRRLRQALSDWRPASPEVPANE
jgi:RNA polymerase sigma-70 factor (ECF subfamily)